jgi:hypothetical protein
LELDSPTQVDVVDYQVDCADHNHNEVKDVERVSEVDDRSTAHHFDGHFHQKDEEENDIGLLLAHIWGRVTWIGLHCKNDEVRNYRKRYERCECPVLVDREAKLIDVRLLHTKLHDQIGLFLMQLLKRLRQNEQIMSSDLRHVILLLHRALDVFLQYIHVVQRQDKLVT